MIRTRSIQYLMINMKIETAGQDLGGGLDQPAPDGLVPHDLGMEDGV